jgi:hypothetical protein
MNDAWVPDACTLPTVEQPVRVAEFDDLFADALNGTRTTSTSRRVEFAPDTAARVRDLTDRESQCCSFFDFRVRPESDRVVLDIGVPASRTPVLDAIEGRLRVEP